MPKEGYWALLTTPGISASKCFAPDNCPGGDTNHARHCFESYANLHSCIYMIENPTSNNITDFSIVIPELAEMRNALTVAITSTYLCDSGSFGRL